MSDRGVGASTHLVPNLRVSLTLPVHKQGSFGIHRQCQNVRSFIVVLHPQASRLFEPWVGGESCPRHRPRQSANENEGCGRKLAGACPNT
jgi:hypothetical protein